MRRIVKSVVSAFVVGTLALGGLAACSNAPKDTPALLQEVGKVQNKDNYHLTDNIVLDTTSGNAFKYAAELDVAGKQAHATYTATVLGLDLTGETYVGEADGGLASDGTWSYAYDAEDQLTSVTSASLTNGAIRVLNTYDYRHRRTSKTVQRLYSTIAPPPSPPVGVEEWQTLETRTFVYDDWNLIHETIYTIDGGTTNAAEVQYFWGLDLSGTIQGAGGVGGLLAVSRNGQFYFPT